MPTRIYVRQTPEPSSAGRRIKAMAHITGGGLIDNVPRVLPDGVVARDRREQPGSAPPVFRWMYEAAR